MRALKEKRKAQDLELEELLGDLRGLKSEKGSALDEIAAQKEQLEAQQETIADLDVTVKLHVLDQLRASCRKTSSCWVILKLSIRSCQKSSRAAFETMPLKLMSSRYFSHPGVVSEEQILKQKREGLDKDNEIQDLTHQVETLTIRNDKNDAEVDRLREELDQSKTAHGEFHSNLQRMTSNHDLKEVEYKVSTNGVEAFVRRRTRG